MSRFRQLSLLFGLYLFVGVVSAHEIGRSRFTAPMPLELLFAGAGGTVALTAGWLGVTTHVTPGETRRRIFGATPSTARLFRVFARVGFFLLFVAVLAHGLFGPQVAAENLATVVVWSVWLKGVGILSILFGSPWRVLSPWESLYDLLVGLEGRELAVLGRPPAWLSSWIAVAGFVGAVGIVENLTTLSASPSTTVLLVASYTLVMVVGAVLFGREWFERADVLTVLYRLLGRVAPLQISRTDAGGYDASLRRPWSGCTDAVPDGSLVVFIVAAVYTVSFDGFTDTPEFERLTFWLRDLLQAGQRVELLVYLVGLVVFVGSFVVAGRAVEAIAGDTGDDWRVTLRAFAPTVVPIAAAYEIAHNYPFVAQNLGQALTVSRNLLGVSGEPITLLGFLSAQLFWGSQVVFIVVGHLVAVVAAHQVALRRYGSLSAARRGHLPLVVVMVGYTVLSLWIISRPLTA